MTTETTDSVTNLPVAGSSLGAVPRIVNKETQMLATNAARLSTEVMYSFLGPPRDHIPAQRDIR